MFKKYLPLLYAAVIVAVLAYSTMTRPEPEILVELSDVQVADIGMEFPEDYRENFVLYLVVDRIDDTVRHIYAHPDAIDAIENDEELPYGTQIIIETWDAAKDMFGNVRRDGEGHLIAATMRPNIHVMEKQPDWTVEQLPTPVGVIDWNFASFDAATMIPSMESRNDCLTCHDGGAFRRDFVFSRFILEDFVLSGETQYLFCSLPRRSNCIR